MIKFTHEGEVLIMRRYGDIVRLENESGESLSISANLIGRLMPTVSEKINAMRIERVRSEVIPD